MQNSNVSRYDYILVKLKIGEPYEHTQSEWETESMWEDCLFHHDL